MSEDRPRLLDLFSGEGGAGVGYHRAGFDVVGVDNSPACFLSIPPEYTFHLGRQLIAHLAAQEVAA